MKTVEVLVLDGGEYQVPAGLSAAMKTMPMRTTTELNWDGQKYQDTRPDSRTPEGQAYYDWLRRQNLLSVMHGPSFEPEDFA